MSNANLFKTPTSTEVNSLIASDNPQGDAWSSKSTPGTVTYSLIQSAGVTLNRLYQAIEILSEELDVNKTVALLPEWERDVGNPDSCSDLAATLEQRRERVIEKLRKTPIVTLAEFQVLGESLLDDPSVTFTVVPGEVQDFPTITNASRFRLYLNFAVANQGFPYAFPLALGGFRSDLVFCVFRKLIPANVVLLFG